MEDTQVIAITFETIFGNERICRAIVNITKEIHKARNLRIVRQRNMVTAERHPTAQLSAAIQRVLQPALSSPARLHLIPTRPIPNPNLQLHSKR